MLTPFYIPPEQAIEIGFSFYSDRKIAKLGNSFFSSLIGRREQFEIIVFGVSHVGKTTLGLFIEGNRTFEDIRKAERSIGFEGYSFMENYNGALIITPGEKRHEEENIKKLKEIIAKKKPFGFINVVSYGYQFAKELEYEDIIPSGKTLENYLEERRQQEIDSIKKLTTLISKAENLTWMLTLVTKQDLWWDKRDEVENYYKVGEYSKITKEIEEEHEKIFGVRNNTFVHKCISSSFVISNVYSKDFKPIAYVIPGYDQYIQIAHWKLIIDTLESLISKHKSLSYS